MNGYIIIRITRHALLYYVPRTSRSLAMEISDLKENDNLSTEQLREKLKSIEQHRHLLIWKDKSTVANHAWVFVMSGF